MDNPAGTKYKYFGLFHWDDLWMKYMENTTEQGN